MRMLVTAGNTWTMLDKVRCITNIFTGRTGGILALEAFGRGHAVTLVTSNAEILRDLSDSPPNCERWNVVLYRTFEDLQSVLEDLIRPNRFDAVLHSAAVSDYQSAGIFTGSTGTQFDVSTGQWSHVSGGTPTLNDRSAGKVKSDESELWIRLVRTPKLVDQFREPWGFRGVLVKFKLEVGKSDAELLTIAERSRQQSNADFIVANTLEEAGTWAFLGAGDEYQKVSRTELPAKLLGMVERSHTGLAHG